MREKHLTTLYRPSNEGIVREYLDWQRDVRRRRAITLYTYAGKLGSFLEWIATTPLSQVSTRQIEAWMQRPRTHRAHGRPAAPATLATERAILSSLYKYALARGHVKDDPTALLGAPAVHNAHPKPIADEVWAPLWSSDLSDEARVVLGLGYFCGLRRAEIAALHGHHVRGERLEGFPRKGGGDDVLDFVQLTEVVHDHLPALVPGGPQSFLKPLSAAVERADGGLLLAWGNTSPAARAKFSRPDTTNDPQLIYKRMKRWGCTFSPHQLRHSFVTNLLRAGVPIHLVSVLANHSSITITMRYAKLGGADLREWRSANDHLTPSSYNRWEGA